MKSAIRSMLCFVYPLGFGVLNCRFLAEALDEYSVKTELSSSWLRHQVLKFRTSLPGTRRDAAAGSALARQQEWEVVRCPHSAVSFEIGGSRIMDALSSLLGPE